VDDSELSGLDNADLIWNREILGSWLRWARLDRGFSLRKLEELSGVDDSEIHRVETGQQECRIETLVRLCGPLGIAPGWILDRVQSSNIATFFELVQDDPALGALLAEFKPIAREMARPIAQNLSCACTLAAILVRSSLPQSRLEAVSFPHPDWEAAFQGFAVKLMTLQESVDRAAILAGLLSRPVQALNSEGLLPRSVIKDQIEDSRRSKSQRKFKDYGWAPWVVSYPRPLSSARLEK